MARMGDYPKTITPRKGISYSELVKEWPSYTLPVYTPPAKSYPFITDGTSAIKPKVVATPTNLDYLPVLERIAKALEAIVERFC